MARSTIDTTSTDTARELFFLDLPDELVVQPTYTIELPRKWLALVYVASAGSPLLDNYDRVRIDQQGQIVLDPRPYYRVRIVTPKGLMSKNFHKFGAHDPLAVAEYLRDVVDKLSIKTVEKKRIQREEGLIEEE